MENVYVKKVCKKTVSIITMLTFFIVSSLSILTTQSTAMAEEIQPNSLKCGDAVSTKGFASLNFTEPSTDDYYVSFDYRYPAGQTMYDFRVWSSYDGSEYDDTVVTQYGNVLKARTGLGTTEPLDITIDPDAWHNIIIHCKADNTYEIFIDGRPAKIGSKYIQGQVGIGKMKAVGYIGDLSSTDHNGCAYWDNIKVFSGSTVFAEEHFNLGIPVGWSFYSTCGLSNPPMDLVPPVLESIALTDDNTSLLIGQTSQFTLSGIMSNGRPAVIGAASSVSYESSNPAAVKVNVGNSIAAVEAVAEGTADITATVTVNGITKQAHITYMSAWLETSLKCGDAASSKGFALFNIPEPETEDYYVNFNYMYPSGQTMSDFRVWSSYDGSEYDDTVVTQFGNTLMARTGLGTTEPLDITVDTDTWYNILFHFKPDNTYEIFINGRQAKIGSKYIQTQVGIGKMKAVGYIGDLSSADHNGCAYFDNIKVFCGNTVLVEESFNHGIPAGWNFYSTCGLANPPSNIEWPALESVRLESDRTGLVIGQALQLDVSCILSDGSRAVMSMADSVEYTSSNPGVAIVEEADGRANVKALGEGTASITANVTYNGVTKQASVEFLVTSVPVLYSVKLFASKIRLLTEDTVQLDALGELTDGSTSLIKFVDNVSYRSSNTNVIALSSVNGVCTARAAGLGKATVTATTMVDNKLRESSIELSVLHLDKITLAAEKNPVFIGNSSRLVLSGMLNDGSAADLSLAGHVNFQSSDPGSARLDTASGGTSITGLAAGEADITAAVTLRGVTRTAVLKVKVVEVTSSKARSTFYTPQKVATARQNVQTYAWATALKNDAVAKADSCLQLGYEGLWNLVTPQSIPRSYAVNQPLGCLNCGKQIDAFGNYPYAKDAIADPWKLECPNCHMKFPTNDFGAYYESGKDGHGIFNPALADKSLLVNTLYPEKGESWGVDDGCGYISDSGQRYTFIAYYNHWGLWYGGAINTALNSLRDAYIYTGDAKYARAGIILLDRIADVYPEMDIQPYKIADGFLNSNGNSNKGKILGSIWETTLAKDFLKAYDAFFPAVGDPQAISFLSGKSSRNGLGVLKNTAAGIKRNIEDGIVRQIYPGVRANAIRGNNGMHQSTLALAAVVLDTLPETREWLDFNFKTGAATADQVTGGNILALLVNDVNRDGHGTEGSPEYNKYWLSQFLETADILNRYDLYPVADLYKNVKFKKMFSAMYPLMLTDLYSALTGDTGAAGKPLNHLDKAQCMRAFEQYGDPVMAQLVYFLNNNRIDGIHGDVFSPDPDKIAADIDNVIKTKGTLKQGSTNLTGYGFAVLRDGENIKLDYGINYDFPKLQVIGKSCDFKIFEASGTLQLEAAQAGDYITFRFNVPQEDEYEIDVNAFKAGSYGRYDIKIDGEYAGSMDFFGTTPVIEALDTKQLSTGEHEISFECTGKNASASSFKMGVIKLSLINQEAQSLRALEGDTQRAVSMYYGINQWHGHADTVNLGINAFKLDLAPDLGYPEYADNSAHRMEWVSNTISHNTVVVDKAKQTGQIISQPRHFDDSEYVKLIDVEAPGVYSQTSTYRRTSAMIKADCENSYVVDFFRVKGGNDHCFSFHGPEGTVAVEGLNLIPQTDDDGQYVGSYAGADIPFGNGSNSPGYTGSGFHWLKNVDRDDNPSSVFSVDWNAKDTWNVYGKGAHAQTDIHLRLTMLGQADDVAVADGIPPRNKLGNPSSLKYMVARKSGQNLDSLFTSVIEPYKGDRYIASVSPAALKVNGQEVNSSDAGAVKVTFKNGRVDYIVNALDNHILYTVDDKFQFKGFFGAYTEENGVPTYSYVNDGETIGSLIMGAKDKLSGTVTGFTTDMSTSNEITIRLSDTDFNAVDFNAGDLAGRYIYVQNDGVRNASYEIKGIKNIDGTSVTLDTGDVTPIRCWKDNNDFPKGYVYDILAGAQFVIPLSDEFITYLSTVTLSAQTPDNNTANEYVLTRGQSIELILNGTLSTGGAANLRRAAVEYVSSDPGIAVVKDGKVIAGNSGSSDVYVKVTLDGVTVQSNPITVKVDVTFDSVMQSVNRFCTSGELKDPLARLVVLDLELAGKHADQNMNNSSVEQLDILLKHLNNEAFNECVSQQAKDVLNTDVKALAESLMNRCN